MIKLTNILHELFAASKNVARFELLAELKISEIDNTLNKIVLETQQSWSKMGIDGIKNWIKNNPKLKKYKWGEIPLTILRNSEDSNLSGLIIHLQRFRKRYSAELKIPSNDINEYWKEFGILSQQSWSKMSIDEIKNWMKSNPELKKYKWGEIPLAALRDSEDPKLTGLLARLQTYRKEYSSKLKISLDDEISYWKEFGISSQGGNKVQGEEYAGINTLKDVKEYLNYLRNVEKIKINIVDDIKNYSLGLYKIILRILNAPPGHINYFKWKELGINVKIDWRNFKYEDWKQLIAGFNLDASKGENYITNLPVNVQDAIRENKSKLKGKDTKEKYNNIGLIYTPLAERVVYAYKFIDIKDDNGIKNNYIYIGLTCNPAQRNYTHTGILNFLDKEENFIKNELKQDSENIKLTSEYTDELKMLNREKGAVKLFIKKYADKKSNKYWEHNREIINNSPMEFMTEEGKFIPEEEAIKLEKEKIDEYKNSTDWKVLNKVSGGSTGGNTPSNPNRKTDDNLKIALDKLEQSQNI